MTYIKLWNVRAFPNVKPDKAQALKPLEEAAGCYGDAETARKWMRYELSRLKEEYEEGAS